MLKSFINQFKGWRRIEIAILLVASAMLMYTSFVWDDTLIGIICTLTGILCVVEVSRGNIWNYFWGLINVVLYIIICYTAGYAGDFMLNLLYYLPMQFIGLYMWKKHMHNDFVDVKVMTKLGWIISAAALIVGTLIVGMLMPSINTMLGMDANPAPFIDAFTTTGSILAMWMMMKRLPEQWLLWIIVDVFSMIMWGVVQKDPVMAIMWTAYTVNAIYGYYHWRQMGAEQATSL